MIRHDSSEAQREFDNVAYRVLDTTIETEGSVYSVRVRNIVNSKGACLFVSLTALLILLLGVIFYSGNKELIRNRSTYLKILDRRREKTLEIAKEMR